MKFFNLVYYVGLVVVIGWVGGVGQVYLRNGVGSVIWGVEGLGGVNVKVFIQVGECFVWVNQVWCCQVKVLIGQVYVGVNVLVGCCLVIQFLWIKDYDSLIVDVDVVGVFYYVIQV